MRKLFISFMCLIFLSGCASFGKINRGMSLEEVRQASQQSLGSKITSLSANTDPQLTDVLYWIDDPGGTPTSEKIVWGTLLDDTKGNGDTAYLWSADKIYDQLALKAPLDSPTLVTPDLGTPSALVLTNATGLPEAQVTQHADAIVTTLSTDWIKDTMIDWGSGASQIDMTDFPVSGSWSPTGTLDISGAAVTFGLVDGDIPSSIDPDKIGTDGTSNDKIEAGNINIQSMDITAVDSIVWNAAGITVDGTQCADPADVTINSGPILATIICTDNDASTMYGHVTMPDGYNGGTVTFELSYIQTAADTSALNSDVCAMCRGTGDTVNSTWGTEIAIDDAAVTGSNAIDTTTSAAVTPNGTCIAGDELFWRIQLDATGTTTAVATLHFTDVKMEFTKTIGDE